MFDVDYLDLHIFVFCSTEDCVITVKDSYCSNSSCEGFQHNSFRKLIHAVDFSADIRVCVRSDFISGPG